MRRSKGVGIIYLKQRRPEMHPQQPGSWASTFNFTFKNSHCMFVHSLKKTADKALFRTKSLLQNSTKRIKLLNRSKGVKPTRKPDSMGSSMFFTWLGSTPKPQPFPVHRAPWIALAHPGKVKHYTYEMLKAWNMDLEVRGLQNW